jgi:hypothetical protein
MPSKNKQYLGFLNNHLKGRMTLVTLYSKALELGVTEAEVDADIARASEENNGSPDNEQSVSTPTSSKGATAAPMSHGD